MLKKGKIHIFTGKGGVGKSMISIAFARALAAAGQNTLWLEFSQTPTIKNFSPSTLSFEAINIHPHLDVMSWNGEDCLQEFVKHSVKLRLIYETFYRSKAITSLIKAAPALREIAFLGYLTSHLRNVEPSLKYDQVVVDAPSTGHFLACLKVPNALLDISRFGPMGFHCKGIMDVLSDPEKASIYSIFLPEPLVLLEHNYLQKELKDLGLTSKAWMNKAVNDQIVSDLKELNSGVVSKFKDSIFALKSQQNDIIASLGTQNLFLTSEGHESNVQKEVSKIVKELIQ